MQQPIEPSRAENISFLAGICFFLSAIEYMLPRPVPFMRIGIANLPILVSLSILDAPSTLVLVLLKSVGQGIITGTLFSYVFLFSLAGSLSSGLAMLGLSRLPEKSVSIVGVSLGGALASNLAQILLARVILFGRGAWLIAPLMLIIGIVSSVLLGLFTWHFTARSEWLSTFAASWEGEERPQNPRVLGSGPSGGAFLVDHISAGGLFACGLISAIGYIFSRSLPLKAALCILYIILAYTARKKLHLLPSIIIFVSVVLFQLITPVGKVMYQIGGFKITQGALE
ncbi:MAG TPA: Gx transporter family protein, partial [Spirochaetia bacterium]|nr:Gx transporter family protein [Spirochaetia bacterium]